MLDTVQRVETPEGVDLDLPVAGPIPRLLAYLVDLTIRILLFVAIMIPASMLGAGGGTAISYIILFVLEWFYPVVLEVLDDGRTPGKRALGLRVVRWDGTPVDWGTSTIRNLLRFADMVPFVVPHLVALISMVLSKRFRRLGDLAAGTLVIYDEPKRRGARIPEVPLQSLPLPLTLDEQRALVSFGQRARGLSEQRARELADIVVPVLNPRAPDPVQWLLGVAARLVGRRSGEGRTDSRADRSSWGPR